MRSLGNEAGRGISHWLVMIGCLLFSSLSLSQQLTGALSLRLGPGIGYPVSIELPSGTYIDITQRRNTWLLIRDERDEGGWAKIAEVGESGGLKERLAWRLTELKKESNGEVVGRWFNFNQGYGLALGWKLPSDYGHWLFEIEKASDAQVEWHSLASWYLSQHNITAHSYYSAGMGLGVAQENSKSQIFSDYGDAQQAVYGGIELALGLRPTKQVNTGLSVRYLFAASSADADETVLSWYWSFGI